MQISDTERTLTFEGLASGSRTVPERSLVVSTRAPIGYVAETTRTMAFNQGCRSLVPTRRVDIRFFRYQFLTLENQLKSLGQGSTFSELSSDDLKSTKVTVPPLPFQEQIADYLDTATARIDSLASLVKAVIDRLHEYRTSLITASVTGRVDVREEAGNLSRKSQAPV